MCDCVEKNDTEVQNKGTSILFPVWYLLLRKSNKYQKNQCEKLPLGTLWFLILSHRGTESTWRGPISEWWVPQNSVWDWSATPISQSTIKAVQIAHYSTQKGAIPILSYMNATFLTTVLYKVWRGWRPWLFNNDKAMTNPQIWLSPGNFIPWILSPRRLLKGPMTCICSEWVVGDSRNGIRMQAAIPCSQGQQADCPCCAWPHSKECHSLF